MVVSMSAPRNLFATKTFYLFTSIVLTAVTPNIAEMVKSGVTIERMLLLGATLSSTGAVLIDRMEKEKNLYTPHRAFGRDEEDAIANVQSIESSSAIVKDVVQDAIANPVAAVQKRAQTIIDTSVQSEPVQEAINDVAANPVSTAKKSIFKIVGNLFV